MFSGLTVPVPVRDPDPKWDEYYVPDDNEDNEELINIIEKRIGELGYELKLDSKKSFDKNVACNNIGIYTICVKDNCEYILKIYKRRQIISSDKVNEDNELEFEFTYRSSLLGVGPKIYYYDECYIAKTDMVYSYIIMDKLSKTLSKITIDDVHDKFFNKILNKFWKLFEHDINHNDLQKNNIMIDENDNIYIIDYGRGEHIYNKDAKVKNFRDNIMIRLLGLEEDEQKNKFNVLLTAFLKDK